MVSRRVFLKIKGKFWIFIVGGSTTTKQKLEKNDEIGQSLVSGALDDTKTIGKVGADIFAKSGPEKPWKNKEKSKFSPDFSPFFPWTLPKTREFPYKRLGAIWFLLRPHIPSKTTQLTVPVVTVRLSRWYGPTDTWDGPSGRENGCSLELATGSPGTEPGTGNRTVLKQEPAEPGIDTEPDEPEPRLGSLKFLDF